jgi:hypothetical protein
MALRKGQDNINLSNKSLALFTVKVANQYKPGYQPNKLLVFIEGANSGAYKVIMESPPHISEKDSFNEYLLSFDLKPGISKFYKIWFIYADTFVVGRANIPFDLEADIKQNSIQYLGHIDTIIREKKNDNEKSAGPLLPLIDQATTGFSSATYDIVIEDKFDDDMKKFFSEYPGLQKVKIDKTVFPKGTGIENKSPAKE